jgi:hypothetical protein
VAKALRDSISCASDDVSSNPHTESHFYFSTFGWMSCSFCSKEFINIREVRINFEKIPKKSLLNILFTGHSDNFIMILNRVHKFHRVAPFEDLSILLNDNFD